MSSVSRCILAGALANLANCERPRAKMLTLSLGHSGKEMQPCQFGAELLECGAFLFDPRVELLADLPKPTRLLEYLQPRACLRMPPRLLEFRKTSVPHRIVGCGL